MIDHVGIDITEAVEAGARADTEAIGLDWDMLSPIIKIRYREAVTVVVNAAAPFIIEQVKADMLSRKYDIR